MSFLELSGIVVSPLVIEYFVRLLHPRKGPDCTVPAALQIIALDGSARAAAIACLISYIFICIAVYGITDWEYPGGLMYLFLIGVTGGGIALPLLVVRLLRVKRRIEYGERRPYCRIESSKDEVEGDSSYQYGYTYKGKLYAKSTAPIRSGADLLAATVAFLPEKPKVAVILENLVKGYAENHMKLLGVRREELIRLFNAVKQGDISTVKEIAEQDQYLEVEDYRGFTPLMLAAKAGTLNVVQLLMAQGANAGKQNIQGETPLLVACRNGKTDIAKMLLEKGADPNAATVTGDTPLIEAGTGGYEDLIALLVDYKADINHQNSEGWMVLHKALWNRHPGAAQLLIKLGAQVNKRLTNGPAPLAIASRNGDLETAKMLIDKGAVVDQQFLFNIGDDSTSEEKVKLVQITALVIAVVRKDLKMMEVLLKAGANPNQPYLDSNHTLLEEFTLSGDIELMELLMAYNRGNMHR